MQTIHAIFENGVFRPVVPVELPEQAEFAFEPRLVSEPASENGAAPDPRHVSEEGLLNVGLLNVYAILSERYHSGHTDTAARHNEHQP
ncbi:MAG: antitoxin family protein [Bythopirellula sp.]|nr:antitoxin family protein [Bythopirellula sp.]